MLKLIATMLEHYCVISPNKLHKVSLNCCDEIEQINGGLSISYAWVNQFEIVYTCIEFVINISAKCDKVKKKLNLKVEEFCRDCSRNFL